MAHKCCGSTFSKPYFDESCPCLFCKERKERELRSELLSLLGALLDQREHEAEPVFVDIPDDAQFEEVVTYQYQVA